MVCKALQACYNMDMVQGKAVAFPFCAAPGAFKNRARQFNEEEALRT